MRSPAALRTSARADRLVMTPTREKREHERLRTAIYRWYRLGERHDIIIEIADWIYATKAVSLPTKKPDEL